MVELNVTMGNKQNERIQPGYIYWCKRDGYFRGIMRSFEEDTRPLIYGMIQNQRERVIEIMGLSAVAKRDDMRDIFYSYGKGDFSYERFIQLLTNQVWEYFYSKKKAPVSIQTLRLARNSFLVSFDIL